MLTSTFPATVSHFPGLVDLVKALRISSMLSALRTIQITPTTNFGVSSIKIFLVGILGKCILAIFQKFLSESSAFSKIYVAMITGSMINKIDIQTGLF